MHRGLVHAFAWTLATGAAVTLSWWGVHTVMSGTAYDPPLAVPLTTQPLSSSTHRAASPSEGASEAPSPTPSASPPTTPPAAQPAQKSAPPSPSPHEGQGDGGDPGKVKGYTVAGGRVVFDLGTSSAELVSATPSAGWRMQVWKQPYWIRVTFTRDGREVSVFCTWNGHPPMIETYEG
ncbi:hypothetical protein ABZZ20_17585 [Streptomyces sp. NPDC006430]|uniref:hypothetical protein n=1 Tax=Streptomyces sp. NPDC006430 TaxID=3154299 RepID=UPI0033A9FFE0